MKTLDNNQKARIADYLNGRAINISDEELQMLADDDQLASECIEIAEIAAEASREGVIVQFPKANQNTAQPQAQKNNSKALRMVIMAAAACLVIAIAIPLFIKNDTTNTDNNTAANVSSSEQQQTAPRKRSMGILRKKVLTRATPNCRKSTQG